MKVTSLPAFGSKLDIYVSYIQESVGEFPRPFIRLVVEVVILSGLIRATKCRDSKMKRFSGQGNSSHSFQKNMDAIKLAARRLRYSRFRVFLCGKSFPFINSKMYILKTQLLQLYYYVSLKGAIVRYCLQRAYIWYTHLNWISRFEYDAALLRAQKRVYEQLNWISPRTANIHLYASEFLSTSLVFFFHNGFRTNLKITRKANEVEPRCHHACIIQLIFKNRLKAFCLLWKEIKSNSNLRPSSLQISKR